MTAKRLSTVALTAAIVCAATTRLARAQDPAPQPATPPPDTTQTTLQEFLGRERLLGDWGGAQRELGSRGVTLGAAFTQFFDWVPVGDDDRGFDYGGKLDFKAASDLSNYVAKGLSVRAHVEFRYGDAPLLAGGTLIPTSSALLFPEADGEEIRLASLFATYMFQGTSGAPRMALSFGRFDMVDMYVKPFTGGEGTEKFMNLAFVAPPIWARTIPPVTEGVIATFLGKDVEPVVTVGLIDSNDEGFFDNGATFMWDVRLPFTPFSLPGVYSVGGEFSSITATSLDQSPWVFIPVLDVPLAEEEGAWTLNLTAHQYVAQDPATKRGWGVFGMLGVTDGDPNFVKTFAHAGVAGNVPFGGRQQDTFGLGYFYSGVSGDLKDTLDPFIRLRKEQGFEFYYTFAPTGWSKLTADLQFIDPFVVASETRAFFAVRWKIEI
jgi:porin